MSDKAAVSELTERDVRRLGKGALLELLLGQSRRAAQLQEALEEAQAGRGEAEALAERLKVKLNEKDRQLQRLEQRLGTKDDKINHLKERLDAKDARISQLEDVRACMAEAGGNPLDLIAAAVDLLSEATLAWEMRDLCATEGACEREGLTALDEMLSPSKVVLQ